MKYGIVRGSRPGRGTLIARGLPSRSTAIEKAKKMSRLSESYFTVVDEEGGDHAFFLHGKELHSHTSNDSTRSRRRAVKKSAKIGRMKVGRRSARDPETDDKIRKSAALVSRSASRFVDAALRKNSDQMGEAWFYLIEAVNTLAWFGGMKQVDMTSKRYLPSSAAYL